MLHGRAVSIRTTLDRLAHVDTVEHSSACDCAYLMALTFAIGLTNIRGAGSIGAAVCCSCVTGQTLTVWSMILRHAISTVTTDMIVAQIDAIFDIFSSQYALLILSTLFVALAEMLRWYLTLTCRITNKAGQTLTYSLVSSTNTMSIEATVNVGANIGTILETGEHTSTGLKVSTGAIVTAGLLNRLATGLVIVGIAEEVGSTFAEGLVCISTADGVDSTVEILANIFAFSKILWLQHTDLILVTFAIDQAGWSIASSNLIEWIAYKAVEADALGSAILWQTMSVWSTLQNVTKIDTLLGVAHGMAAIASWAVGVVITVLGQLNVERWRASNLEIVWIARMRLDAQADRLVVGAHTEGVRSTLGGVAWIDALVADFLVD